MAEPVLNHFATFQFTEAYWALPGEDRRQFGDSWIRALHEASSQFEIYQVYPTRADADLLIWSALKMESPADAGAFFERYAKAVNAQRRFLTSPLTLWGVTKPSVYSSGPPSEQEIDPFSGIRKPYLVIYPFVKTVEWYLHSQDTRRGMMNEHIRTGKKYPEISQLLLYSFGLQDQEFIVSYETEDLIQFSQLVTDLRSSEARKYTERDTPIITGIHRPAATALDLWA